MCCYPSILRLLIVYESSGDRFIILSNSTAFVGSKCDLSGLYLSITFVLVDLRYKKLRTPYFIYSNALL